MYKLEIRPWKESDYVSLAKHANNIKIWENVRDSFPHPYLEKDAKSFISYVLKRRTIGDFAVVVNNLAVGGVGFTPQYDVERFNAEIGYWLGEEYWNKGIMTKAVDKMIKYIFSETEIIRLYGTAFEHNIASKIIFEKLGFTKTAVLNKAAFKQGVFTNLHYYELLKP